MVKNILKIIGQGPPVILLHGWGWSADIWQPIVPELKQNFQLFLVNLPGFDTFEKISETLFSILPPRAIWLGWSLGGMLALWIAAHHPERITHLITIATSPKFTKGDNWPGVPLTTLENFSKNLINHQQQTLIEFLELQLRGSEQQEKIISDIKPFLENSSTNLLPLLNGLTLLRDTDLRNDLKKISCPNLHIFGKNDTLVSPKIIPFLEKNLPLGHCEVISRTGHMPFLSHSQVFIEILFRFLSASNFQSRQMFFSLNLLFQCHI